MLAIAAVSRATFDVDVLAAVVVVVVGESIAIVVVVVVAMAMAVMIKNDSLLNQLRWRTHTFRRIFS